MRGRQWKNFAMATAAALVLTACSGDDAADDTMDTEAPAPAPAEQVAVDLPEGLTQEEFQEGKQLFTGRGGCHACHGPNATGTQLAPDLTDDEWLNVSGPDADEITQMIKTGVPQPVEHPAPMPPMGGANLTDAQVRALAVYVVGIAG